MSFFSILRAPDSVIGATELTPFRFEESAQDTCPVKYEYKIKNGVGKLIVYPSGSPIKYLKLRFRGELNFVEKVMGDQWERSGLKAFIEWRSIMAHRVLPWFCYLIGDNTTACYGVKVQPNAMCYFQVDTHGISLIVNLCSGNEGVDLKEPIVACEVVELIGKKGQDCYEVASNFAKLMCENPVLPKTPVYGILDWYWAYGNTSEKTVLEETEKLVELCKGNKNPPYVIIDDGWQISREVYEENPDYIGGPWNQFNSRHPNFDKMPKKLHEKGAKAGLWFRPLLTKGDIPKDAVLYNGNGGIVLDPSHPFTLDRVYSDAKRFKEWGFDLLKHDFTVIDGTQIYNTSSDKDDVYMVNSKIKFYDKTKTTAMIFKDLYKTIQNAFGGDVMACNAFSHLSAGIHSIYRVGDDNSGHAFEWTRRDGINSIMRLPTNRAFYLCDPDVGTFTKKTPSKPNLDFLEVCALTGMTCLASITPNILTEEEKKEISRIFKIASEGGKNYKIVNFDKNANPEEFISPDGKNYIRFDWDNHYDGSRNLVDWFD